MLLFGPNVLFFCFIVASAKGEAVLEVLKNENGKETSVSSTIEIGNGANFSLECRVVDSKSGNKLNDQIIWEKFVEIQGIKILENIIVASTVIFIPVSVKHQGQYACLSPKYALRKIISLKVTPETSFDDLRAGKQPLRYFSGRLKKRSNESIRDSVNTNSKPIFPVDTFTTTDEKTLPHDLEHNQWDVKKVKLYEENETLANSVRYHDGTTGTFRIGLLVSFVVLAMIGIYRIFKCWRTGTLGPLINRARASTVTPQTPNNYQETCDSNQTTITTCALQNENGLNNSVNGGNPNLPDFTMSHPWSNNCLMDESFNNEFGRGQLAHLHINAGAESNINNSHNLLPVANVHNDWNKSNIGSDLPPSYDAMVCLEPSAMPTTKIPHNTDNK